MVKNWQGIEKRIEKNRMKDFHLELVNEKGEQLKDWQIKIKLLEHEFLFGCNGFNLEMMDDQKLQQKYSDSFENIFNYATLPFYWGSYEPSPGETRQDKLTEMAEWCCKNRIAVKGHPLVWHEVFPEWAKKLSDDEVLLKLEERVKSLVTNFSELVDYWDVFNEATVSQRFENTVGRWVARKGAAQCVAEALKWARQEESDAKLIYNDFNISSDFEDLIANLQKQQAPFDCLGIQSHMHTGTWSFKKVWDVCENYAQSGLPLHFTELTVLSGRLKSKDEEDWHKKHTDWHTTSEGEEEQAEYGEKLYRLLFSHPSVEAITWWDFSDYSSWQGAPAGLLRKDMSPKPLYNRLDDLINNKWHTEIEGNTNELGLINGRGYCGRYKIEAKHPGNQKLEAEFSLLSKAEGKSKVILQLP